jgi:hypothetical protein
MKLANGNQRRIPAVAGWVLVMLLLLQPSSVVLAWLPPATRSSATRTRIASASAKSGLLLRAQPPHESPEGTPTSTSCPSLSPSAPATTRRQLCQQMLLAVASGCVVGMPVVARAEGEEDPLDTFGQALSNGSTTAAPPPRWPDTTVSPLLPPPVDQESPPSLPPSVVGSDLDNALQGMEQNKQVDPLTHG